MILPVLSCLSIGNLNTCTHGNNTFKYNNGSDDDDDDDDDDNDDDDDDYDGGGDDYDTISAIEYSSLTIYCFPSRCLSRTSHIR